METVPTKARKMMSITFHGTLIDAFGEGLRLLANMIPFNIFQPKQ